MLETILENYIKRTRVKVCGITCTEDAIRVANAGADAIGLVFYKKSPRYVTQEQAADIAKALPPFISRVGLCVNASDEKIRAILETVPIDILQFHGEEDRQTCESYGLPYIKVLRMKDNVDLYQLSDDYASASALLLDSFVDGIHGGTGQKFAWSAIPVDLDKRIILAGGLTAENVAKAIVDIAPYAVDVSSGVEIEPGIKDPEKIKRFMQEVMHAN